LETTVSGVSGGREARSRLANVTGLLLREFVGKRAVDAPAEGRSGASTSAALWLARLERLFVESVAVGGDPSEDPPGFRVVGPRQPESLLAALVVGLEHAEGEWVLVVGTGPPPSSLERLLALIAWPMAPAVVPDAEPGEAIACALLERASCLPVARRLLASGECTLEALLEGVESVRLPWSAFGFAAGERDLEEMVRAAANPVSREPT